MSWSKRPRRGLAAGLIIACLALVVGSCTDEPAAVTFGTTTTTSSIATTSTPATTTTEPSSTTTAPVATTSPVPAAETVAPTPITVLRVTTSPSQSYVFEAGQPILSQGAYSTPGPYTIDNGFDFNSLLYGAYATACGSGSVEVTLLVDRGGEEIALDDMFVRVFYALDIPGIDLPELWPSVTMRYLGEGVYRQRIHGKNMQPMIPPPGRTPAPTGTVLVYFRGYEGLYKDDTNHLNVPVVFTSDEYETDARFDYCNN